MGRIFLAGRLSSPVRLRGLIDGLLYLGAMIPADFCFVVPPRVPHHRVVAAIVHEIEVVHSSVKQQHFKALAIDVLEHRWPGNAIAQTQSPSSSPTPTVSPSPGRCICSGVRAVADLQHILAARFAVVSRISSADAELMAIERLPI